MAIRRILLLRRRLSKRIRDERRRLVAKHYMKAAREHPLERPVWVVARWWRLAPRTIYAILAGER